MSGGGGAGFGGFFEPPPFCFGFEPPAGCWGAVGAVGVAPSNF